jgi:hypothetical protein
MVEAALYLISASRRHGYAPEVSVGIAALGIPHCQPEQRSERLAHVGSTHLFEVQDALPRDTRIRHGRVDRKGHVYRSFALVCSELLALELRSARLAQSGVWGVTSRALDGEEQGEC